MNLHVAYDQGRFAANDGQHSAYDLTSDEFLQLLGDLNSGRFNAAELFEQANERRSGTIK